MKKIKIIAFICAFGAVISLSFPFGLKAAAFGKKETIGVSVGASAGCIVIVVASVLIDRSRGQFVYFEIGEEGTGQNVEQIKVPLSLRGIPQISKKLKKRLDEFSHKSPEQHISLASLKDLGHTSNQPPSGSIEQYVSYYSSSYAPGASSKVLPDSIGSSTWEFLYDSLYQNVTNITLNTDSNSQDGPLDESTPVFDGDNFDKSTVVKIIVPSSVRLLGPNAFYEFNGLRSIEFEENSKLQKIGCYSFANCSDLRQVTMPKSLKIIEEFAFVGCGNLEKIFIPSSVTVIGRSAFSMCLALNEINFGENSELTILGEWAFNGCSALEQITIPPSVEKIKNGAFSNCAKLKTVDIPENSKLKKIGKGAFNDCTSLATIKFPNTLESIGKGAFQNSGLAEVVIPANVEIIEEDTFRNCKKLNFVKTAENSKLKTIARGVFKGCDSLTPDNVELPKDCNNIKAAAFPSDFILNYGGNSQ